VQSDPFPGTIESAMNRTRAFLPVLLLAATMIAGCDGVYIYQYRGRLVSADKRTAVSGARVSAFPEPIECSKESSSDAFVTTDHDGRFTGSLAMLTGWVFALRPPPPPLVEVSLCVQVPGAPQKIEIPISTDAQSDVVSGKRQLDLGTVIVPQGK
jgi:hypothetical protein